MAKKVTLIPQAKGGWKDRSGKTYSQSKGEKMIKTGIAQKAEWHGGKRPYITGTSGRQQGSKNLKRTAAGLENQHGVTFTEAEKKALESAVNTANRRRKRMIEQEKNLPLFVAGEYKGVDVGHRIGPESDFILSRKSKSLQRFKTREEFENYMDNLKRVNSPEYLTDRIRSYKRNHMKAIENVFGDDAKDVLMKIRMMKPEEYMRMVQSDEILEVSFVYDPSALSGKLNQLRRALGMKEKDEDLESEYE